MALSLSLIVFIDRRAEISSLDPKIESESIRPPSFDISVIFSLLIPLLSLNSLTSSVFHLPCPIHLCHLLFCLMASISVPCPKAAAIPRNAALARRLCSPLIGFSQISLLKGSAKRHSPILNAKVATEKSLSVSMASTMLKTESSNGKIGEESKDPAQLPESVISAFMAEVSDLVKLVDSRDITELQLKQNDCELIIRKKEALPQVASSPVMMMQPSQAMYQPPPPVPSAVPPIPASAPPAASAPALPAPAKGNKSSHPPLKCPMAGTFYRCPGPGEPPFVKVGDKVKKGQVVCIIEAMKLMNEIEADQDGTVVDIIAEDGKPVSIDTPLLVIEP